MKTLATAVSKQQFDELFKKVSNWGVWGTDDERGTLNYITPETIRRAAALIQTGRAVSMAVPISKIAGPDKPISDALLFFPRCCSPHFPHQSIHLSQSRNHYRRRIGETIHITAS
jgi:hypothetical protein